MPNKDGVMPAGSMPPVKEEAEAPAPEKEDTAKPAEKLLGKFESPEDMAKSYEDLEKTLGRQKSELGNLRQELESVKSQPAQQREEAPDFQAARDMIEAKVEEGEISVAEGMLQLTDLTKQETAAEMESKFAAYDEKRTATDQYNDFVSSNPDFLEMENNGMLSEEMQKNPMHDKFSAYFAVKARVEADAAYEKGKEEALKLAKGADGTRSVLSKPGGEARETPKPQKGMNDGDKVSGMLSALKAARGQ